MKIAIAMGPCFPVPTVQGGAHHRLWQGLAEEFVLAGHEVTILCRSYPGQPAQETIRGVHYVRQGGFDQSTRIWKDLLQDLAYALSLVPTLPHADVLVINDFWLPVFAPLRPQAGKVVVSVGRFPKGQYRLYRKIERIIVLSQVIWDAIAAQHPPAIPQLRLIPNPVDTKIFCPTDRAKPAPDERVVLYVGRLHPEKGVHLLIEAFSMLAKSMPSVRLTILGPYLQNQGGGGEGYYNQLKLQAEGLNVEFLPPVFNVQALAKIYQQADVFCYPSLAAQGEAFPVAPLEAMATGLPVVTSDLACFKDYMRHGETGYVFNHTAPDPAKQLAETLALALADPDQTTRLGRNALVNAQNYSYTKIADLYLNEFKQLI